MRIGNGYDVHQLVEGRPLILGGVQIPHTHGLLGHSDADVLTHAIMDALLGSLALGDIGVHFPDTDEAYAGADSIRLLHEVGEMIADERYAIVNIDAIIIAQKPKLAAHIPRMRENIAGALGLETSCVSVKATTEEHLGFTGRCEGIAAQAVCLVESMFDRALTVYDSTRSCAGCGGCPRVTQLRGIKTFRNKTPDRCGMETSITIK